MMPRKFYAVSLICLLSLPLLGADSVSFTKADAMEDWQAKPVIVENTEITGSVPVYNVNSIEKEYFAEDFYENLISEIDGVHEVKNGICIADNLSPVGIPYATEYKFFATSSEEEYDLSNLWVTDLVDESEFSHGYVRDLRDDYDGQLGRPFYFVFTKRGQLNYTFYFSIDTNKKKLGRAKYNEIREFIFTEFGFYIDSYDDFVANLCVG